MNYLNGSKNNIFNQQKKQLFFLALFFIICFVFAKKYYNPNFISPTYFYNQICIVSIIYFGGLFLVFSKNKLYKIVCFGFLLRLLIIFINYKYSNYSSGDEGNFVTLGWYIVKFFGFDREIIHAKMFSKFVHFSYSFAIISKYRDFFLGHLLGIFFLIFGFNLLPYYIFSSLISTSASYIIYRTISLFQNQSYQISYLFALMAFPPFLYYNSKFLKESWTAFFISIILFYALRAIKEEKYTLIHFIKKPFFWIAIILLYFFRVKYFIFIAPCLVLYYFYSKFERIKMKHSVNLFPYFILLLTGFFIVNSTKIKLLFGTTADVFNPERGFLKLAKPDNSLFTILNFSNIYSVRGILVTLFFMLISFLMPLPFIFTKMNYFRYPFDFIFYDLNAVTWVLISMVIIFSFIFIRPQKPEEKFLFFCTIIAHIVITFCAQAGMITEKWRVGFYPIFILYCLINLPTFLNMKTLRNQFLTIAFSFFLFSISGYFLLKWLV